MKVTCVSADSAEDREGILQGSEPVDIFDHLRTRKDESFREKLFVET